MSSSVAKAEVRAVPVVGAVAGSKCRTVFILGGVVVAEGSAAFAAGIIVVAVRGCIAVAGGSEPSVAYTLFSVHVWILCPLTGVGIPHPAVIDLLGVRRRGDGQAQRERQGGEAEGGMEEGGHGGSPC